MNRGSPTASTMEPLTLPTSVTIPGPAASASRRGDDDGANRRGEERDLRQRVATHRVEGTQLERSSGGALVPIVSGDVPPLAAQGQPDGAADQSGADDGGAVRCH